MRTTSTLQLAHVSQEIPKRPQEIPVKGRQNSPAINPDLLEHHGDSEQGTQWSDSSEGRAGSSPHVPGLEKLADMDPPIVVTVETPEGTLEAYQKVLG